MSFTAPNAKRSKLEAQMDIVPSSFERELAEIERAERESDESLNKKNLWRRPGVPKDWNDAVNNLVFQQIEADESSTSVKYINVPESEKFSVSQSIPTIRFFGATASGCSVACHVHGFFPYFYVPAPLSFEATDMPEFLNKLCQMAANETKVAEVVVISADLVLKESIMNFHGCRLSNYIKITVSQPKHVNTVKKLFEQGRFSMHRRDFVIEFGNLTYESNLAYLLRYMIDWDIGGMTWLELPAGKYKSRLDFDRESTCQLEVDIHYSHVIAHLPESSDQWSRMAPLRILSFDIECSGRKGYFPDPKVDPVIQIANMVTIQGESKPFIRNVFTLGTCAHIVGSQVISFSQESEMLAAWAKFVGECDPDIVTGYNILNFDLPYMLDRAAQLNVDDFPYLSRLPGDKTSHKDSRFSSRAFGTRESKQVELPGRIVLDLLPLMTREHKLRSYSLNSVSAHFLNEQKEDVHFSIIADLQNGDEETRRRLAVYCLKDALLPQRLLDKLMCVINLSEMARVTGVPFNYLLTRGQQIKVISQLLRKTKTQNLIVPSLRIGEGAPVDATYEGATVIEPECGYYDIPIATLDFASLYPSIMMAHNLCYTTLVERNVIESMGLVKDDDYIVTPTRDCFVTAKRRKGLLPIILEDLLEARKRAKNDLKKETDPFRRAVLDGRQLALKLSANSVYGFTGATIGKLPCLQISSSVTGFGREMIMKTKQIVTEHYTKSNGYAHDAHVIYGDTDSVMVRFGPKELSECMELGRQAASYVSNYFTKPIQLEFEKVYFPYLLMNKKRYAGIYWTKPDKYDKMDCKGIETVRRDNCTLVAHVIDTCLRKILIERNVPSAIGFVKKTISDLLQNKIDLSQLVISKALAKAEYAGKQAHVELAERMRKRDAGSAPNVGDRVAYVIIKGSKNAAAYEKAEDPLYVLENNLPIDTQYYLENQLSNPLIRIFEPILGSQAESILLHGEHTRSVSVAAPASGGLMKFAVRQRSCLGCKGGLKSQTMVVCNNCKPRIAEIYARQIDLVNTLESKFARLWTQCQNCQGSLHHQVICSANDCPIFYMRRKIQTDTKEASQVLLRFDCTW